MKKIVLMAWSIVLLMACEKEASVMNGINKESFEESVEIMKRELPSDQMPKLEEAIQIIFTYNTHQDTDSLRWSRTRHLLNQKNADEIFTMAERTAKEKGINWNRTSLGLLDLSKLPSVNANTPEDNPNLQILKNVKSAKITSKVIDQNHDKVYDALMVFVTLLDEEGHAVEFQEAENTGDLTVYSDHQKVLSKNFKMTHSQLGNPSLGRGLILPFHALNAEHMKGDEIDVSVKVITPHAYFSANENALEIPYTKYVEHTRVDQEAIAKDKAAAEATVTQFLDAIGQGNLKAAHDLSVNSEWKDFKQFSSKDLGYGDVSGVTLTNIKTTQFDPEKEKAQVQAEYTFLMKKEQEVPLKKLFYLQKIADQWKIVSTKKLN